jgi:hypothetical protein
MCSRVAASLSRGAHGLHACLAGALGTGSCLFGRDPRRFRGFTQVAFQRRDYRCGTGTTSRGATRTDAVGLRSAVVSRDQEDRQDDRRSAHDNRGDLRRLDTAVVLPLAHQYKWRATMTARLPSASAINKGSSSPISNNQPMSLMYVTRLTSPHQAVNGVCAAVAERGDTSRPYRCERSGQVIGRRDEAPSSQSPSQGCGGHTHRSARAIG